MPFFFRTMVLFFLLFLCSALAPAGPSFHADEDGADHDRAAAPAGTAWAATEGGSLERGEGLAHANGDTASEARPPVAEPFFSGSALGALLFGYTFKGLSMADILLLAVLGFAVFRMFAAQRKDGRARDATGPESPGVRLQWPGKKKEEDSPPRERDVIETDDSEERGRFSEPEQPPDAPREQRRPPTVQESAANAWARLRSAPAGQQEDRAVTRSAAAQAYRDMANLPSGLDVADFLEGARALYVRLEEAWASRRVEDIAPFVTVGMMRLIREQAGRGTASGRADILFINATLDSFAREGNWDVAEVRFIVTMRESENGGDAGDPVEVREIWRIVRGPENGDKWQLDGIRQI